MFCFCFFKCFMSYSRDTSRYPTLVSCFSRFRRTTSSLIFRLEKGTSFTASHRFSSRKMEEDSVQADLGTYNGPLSFFSLVRQTEEFGKGLEPVIQCRTSRLFLFDVKNIQLYSAFGHPNEIWSQVAMKQKSCTHDHSQGRACFCGIWRLNSFLGCWAPDLASHRRNLIESIWRKAVDK